MIRENPGQAPSAGAFRLPSALPYFFNLLWVGSTLWGLTEPGRGALVTSLPLLAMLGFAFSHGQAALGTGGILRFFVIAVVVANIYENISINTGFPFGLYHHTAAMGPKILDVPVIVGLLFFAGSYIAWGLAGLILGRSRSALTTPILAAFIVTGWDLSGDAIGATVQGNWRYAEGGGFFGVPLSNFLGWYLTTWTIFQLFALTGQRPGLDTMARRLALPLFWGAMSLLYPLLFLMAPAGEAVDPAGRPWRLPDLFETMAIVSIFTMLMAAVLAFIRAFDRN